MGWSPEDRLCRLEGRAQLPLVKEDARKPLPLGSGWFGTVALRQGFREPTVAPPT